MASASTEATAVISTGHVQRIVQHYESSSSSSYVTAASRHSTESAPYESALALSVTDDTIDEISAMSNKFITLQELFTGLSTLFSCLVTSVSIHFPGEKHTGTIKCVLTYLFTICYVGSYLLKVLFDWLGDRAHLFHYDVTRGGKSVFYPKSVVHVVGILVIFAAYQTTSFTLNREGPWVMYFMSLTNSILSGVYGLVQVYKSDAIHALVVTRDGHQIRQMIRNSPNNPPSGRIMHHEVDPTVPESLIE